jgi:hypothetical protein
MDDARSAAGATKATQGQLRYVSLICVSSVSVAGIDFSILHRLEPSLIMLHRGAFVATETLQLRAKIKGL